MRSVGSIKVSSTHSSLNLLLTARTVWLLMEAARMFAIRGTALIIRNILICKHKRIVKYCHKNATQPPQSLTARHCASCTVTRNKTTVHRTLYMHYRRRAQLRRGTWVMGKQQI